MSTAQRAFSSGEVSPAVAARADLAAYQTGLVTCRNATVLRSGGVRSRPGTLYQSPTKENDPARLIPCEFAADQAYTLELGDQSIRFRLNGALVTVGTPSDWLTATAYDAGDLVANDGDNYIAIADHTSGAANEPGTGVDWEDFWYLLEDDILELPTPWTAAMVPYVQVGTASKTTLFLGHPDVPLRELTRLSATSWTLTETVYGVDTASVVTPTGLAVTGADGNEAPFTRYFVTAIVGLVESAPSGIDGWNKRPGPTTTGNKTPLTIEWDEPVVAVDAYRIYRSYSNGPFLLVEEVRGLVAAGGNFAYEDLGEVPQTGEPYAYTSTRTVGTFTTAGRYPGVVGIFQQRLVLGGQTAEPDAMYASRSLGGYRNFLLSDPIRDDDGFAWKQASTRLNLVRYVAEAAGRLAVFTDVGEGLAMGDVDGILRPQEINPRMFTWNGIAGYPGPLNLPHDLLYVQREGSLVRAFVPAEAQGPELTVLSQHLVDGYTIVSWCFQPTPEPIVWAVRSDGVLLSLTFFREGNVEGNVVGWARHDTEGAVEAVCCVRETTGAKVDLVIRRAVGEETVRYVERFANRLAVWPTTVLVDSARTTADAGVEIEDEDETPSTPAGTTLLNLLVNTVANPDRIEEANTANAQHEVRYDAVDFTSVYSRYEFAAYLQQSERTWALVWLELGGGLFADAYVNLVTGEVTSSSVSAQLDLTAVAVANGAGWDFTLSCQVAEASRTAATAALLAETGLAQLVITPALAFGDGGIYTGATNSGIIAQVTQNVGTEVLPPRVTGFAHLAGMEVSVLADGIVLASPSTGLRPVFGDYVPLTADELATYESFTIGLPYIVDVGSLDLDHASGTRLDSGINVKGMGLWLEHSDGPWMGQDEPDDPSATGADVNLRKMLRTDAKGTEQAGLMTGYREAKIFSGWTRGGRTFLRHVDPTPFTLLGIALDAEVTRKH